MVDSQIVAAITELLDRSNRVLVAAHVQPDGDAFSSLLATGLALERLGFPYDLVCDDKAPRRFNYLKGASSVLTETPDGVPYDLLIAVDAADIDRMGWAYKSLEYPKPPIINIDHHVTNTNYGAVNYIDGRASSTTELLFRLFPLLGVEIDRDIASCLLTGLVTDTLNFSTSGVGAATLRAAAELVEAGADLFEITSQGYKLQKLSTLTIWGIGLKNLKVDDGLLWTTISSEERLAAGHSGSSSFGLGNFMADVYQAVMSAVLVEMDGGQVSVGFRCRPPFNVAEIAAALGGGGHRLAAGCTINGSLQEAEDLVINQSKAAMHKQRNGLSHILDQQ